MSGSRWVDYRFRNPKEAGSITDEVGDEEALVHNIQLHHILYGGIVEDGVFQRRPLPGPQFIGFTVKSNELDRDGFLVSDTDLPDSL